MRYIFLLALAFLPRPAAAIVYQFETFEASPGVIFDARVALRDDSPFFAEVDSFFDVVTIDTSSNFLRLDLRIDDNGDGTDIVLTPTAFNSSEDFDRFTLSSAAFDYLGFNSSVGGSSSGGLTDFWTLSFDSDQFLFETRTLTGSFVEVSEPAAVTLLLIGLAAVAGRRTFQGLRRP